jgi:hypothetical protein
MADFGDDAILDADISVVRRNQRTINDRSSLNKGIKLCHIALLYGAIAERRSLPYCSNWLV